MKQDYRAESGHVVKQDIEISQTRRPVKEDHRANSGHVVKQDIEVSQTGCLAKSYASCLRLWCVVINKSINT